MTLAIHIVAGSLALLSGYVALIARKGERLHRRTGKLFTYAMLTMAGAAVAVAVAHAAAPAINIPMALLAAYLVFTAMTTVRPAGTGARELLVGAITVALAVGLTDLAFGLGAIARGESVDGIPAFPFFLFGSVALLGAAGDLRVLRSGNPRGARRIARHLWRMCLALQIAALAFFIGQSDEFPEAIRIVPLLVLPPLFVLAAMIYWLWRVRTDARWRLQAD